MNRIACLSCTVLFLSLSAVGSDILSDLSAAATKQTPEGKECEKQQILKHSPAIAKLVASCRKFLDAFSDTEIETAWNKQINDLMSQRQSDGGDPDDMLLEKAKSSVRNSIVFSKALHPKNMPILNKEMWQEIVNMCNFVCKLYSSNIPIPKDLLNINPEVLDILVDAYPPIKTKHENKNNSSNPVSFRHSFFSCRRPPQIDPLPGELDSGTYDPGGSIPPLTVEKETEPSPEILKFRVGVVMPAPYGTGTLAKLIVKAVDKIEKKRNEKKVP